MTLIVHHLHVSASERLIWLCEELAIPYTMKTYRRAPILAPAEYKSLHPSGAAPVIEDEENGLAPLAETGACIQYICHQYAAGKLFIPPGHPLYADFLYWWHWANGTFQPALGQAMVLRRYEKGDAILQLQPEAGAADGEENKSPNISVFLARDRLRRGLQMLDERLEEREWLMGDHFTVADVMIVFSLTTMRHFLPYSLQGYDHVVRYLGRVGNRQAYRRAMSKCEPEREVESVLGVESPKGFR